MPKNTIPHDAAVDAPTVSVTDETLEQTPGRVLMFLRAIGTTEAIRMALATVGYEEAEHALGWSLLHGVSGFTPSTASAPSLDAAVVKAVGTLDAADERLHRVVDASLKHRFPKVRDALLKGITPGRGAASVLYVRTLLARLDALKKGEEAEALALLAKRSLTPAYRHELAALVKQAESFVAPQAAPVADGSQAAKLRALRAWYEEWSELARGELARKDYLLKLGLARRKRPTKAALMPPTG